MRRFAALCIILFFPEKETKKEKYALPFTSEGNPRVGTKEKNTTRSEHRRSFLRRSERRCKKVQDLNGTIVNIYGTAECGELLAKKVSKEQVQDRAHHSIVCTGLIADSVAALYDILYGENK